MNGIEDRLRTELKEFALRAQPEAIRPLRVPAPRRRTRTARWLAPVAAAAAVVAAVVAVVAGVTLAGHTSNRPVIGAPAGMPPYYVVLMETQHPAHGRTTVTETASVYDSATGHLLDKVRVPTGDGLSASDTISAAANDRLFAISANGGGSIFLLRLAANGRSEGLQKLPVKDGAAAGITPELSPDGSQLAYITQNCAGGCVYGVGVVPVTRPSAVRIWQSDTPADQLSWAGQGNQVMFGMETTGQAQKLQYRLLNATGRAGNLLSQSRPINIPAALSEAPVLLTSDGRTAVGSTQQTEAGLHTVTGKIVELSRSTGRQRVLYAGTEHYTSKQGVPTGAEGDYCSVQSLTSTGVQPLVFCFKHFGRIVGSKFTPLPGESNAPANRTVWNAAW